MRIDLFELLDGLFRGVLFFFYNVFETVVVSLRYPFRGPIYLYAAHLMKGRRQISALTFLFLALFLMLGAVNLLVGTEGEEAARKLIFSHSFDVATLWPTTIASLTATAAIDLPLRLAFRIRGRRRRTEQRRAVAWVEYASFLPIIITTLVAGILWMVGLVLGEMFGGGDRAAPWVLLVLALPFAIVASIPAGTLLAAGWNDLGEEPRASGPGPMRRVGRKRFRPVATLFFGTLAFAGVLVGLRVQEGPLLERFARTVQVVALRCALEAQPPQVEAVLHNPSDRAVGIDLRRLWLSLGDTLMVPDPDASRPDPSFALRPLSPTDPVYFALPAGGTATIRAELPPQARQDDTVACLLNGRGEGYVLSGRPEFTDWTGRRPRNIVEFEPAR